MPHDVVLNSPPLAHLMIDKNGQNANARAMFVREKRIGPYTYIYLVETVREDGRVKQRIIRNLGRKEEVERSGDLDRLARSATRLAQRSMILSLLEEGGGAEDLGCQRIGPPLLFE